MKRLFEIDFFRGLAIIMMLLSNFLLDLNIFSLCSYCYSGFWFYFARLTAILFLTLVGISLTLSYSRVSKPCFKKYLKRGTKIFCYGLLITLITFVFFNPAFVMFGILHLIGVSIILSYPLLSKRLISLILGLVIIFVGFFVQTMFFDFSWLFWLGLQYPGLFSVDYTPILPWFGFVLVGVFLGNVLYPKQKPRLGTSKNPVLGFISFLGRNSLKIYFIHQPIFLAIITLFF